MKKTVLDWVPFLVKSEEKTFFCGIEIPELWGLKRKNDLISSCEFRAFFSSDSSSRACLVNPMPLKQAMCIPSKCKGEKCCFIHQKDLDASEKHREYIRQMRLKISKKQGYQTIKQKKQSCC